MGGFEALLVDFVAVLADLLSLSVWTTPPVQCLSFAS